METLFAVVAALGMAGYLCIFVTLHVLPTGYSPIGHAVSDYGVGRYAGLFRIAGAASSVGILCLAVALTLEPGTPTVSVFELVCLYLIPVFRIAILRFPTDLEGQRLTRNGRLHYLFAILAFAATYSAIAGMTPELTSIDPWNSIHGLLHVLQLIAMVSLILLVIAMIPQLRRVFGLFERLFLTSTNLWFLLVAAYLTFS
ncbi:DUF998 domain-containing protein [Kribbella sp. NPDC055071]